MVKDLDLFEVSLLNREKVPAYDGTLVSVRSADGEEKQVYISDSSDDEIELTEDATEDVKEVEDNDEAIAEAQRELRDEPEKPEEKPEGADNGTKSFDNSKYKNIIAELKTLRDSVK